MKGFFLSWYMAWRFFSAERRRILNVLYILVSSVGVLALLTILGIMNLLQHDVINTLVRNQSFHLRISHVGKEWRTYKEDILHIQEVDFVTPFIDITAFLQSKIGTTSGLNIRAVEGEYFSINKKLKQEKAFFLHDFSQIDSSNKPIVITQSIANQNMLRVGDLLTLYMIFSSKNAHIVRNTFLVIGIIEDPRNIAQQVTGYIPLASLPSQYERSLGIMLKDIQQTTHVYNYLKSRYQYGETWYQTQHGVVSALRLEKLLLVFFLMLVFLVMGFNSYLLFRRAIKERTEDLALLHALGLGTMRIRAIFSKEGWIIGIISAMLGSIAGLLVLANIPAILTFINYILGYLYISLHWLLPFLSPLSFYWHVLPWIQDQGMLSFMELFLVFLSCCIIPYIAARVATRRLYESSPIDLIRGGL